MYKQKGGLLLPYNDEKKSNEIFSQFINNAENINYISKGTYGIILEITLGKNSIPNNYSQISPDENYGTPVSNILIKLCGISNKDVSFKVGTHDIIYPVTQSEFQNEINIQTDVYLKTIKYLQPLCPGIVYANIQKDKEIEDIENLILKKIKYTDKILPIVTNLFNEIKNNDVELGIIGMEFVKNGHVLKMYNNHEGALNICRYALLRLALDTGYNHNDFHQGNILIMSNVDNYFSTIDKRPIIIDFGRATKISPSIMEKIKKKVKNKEYIKALKYLCNYNTANEFIKDPYYNEYYGWVCGNYNSDDLEYLDKLVENLIEHDDSNETKEEKLNKIKRKINSSKYHPFDDMKNIHTTDKHIDYLFQMREKSIDENIEIMKTLHNIDSKYPLLPIISSNIKNNLYNGMLGGKKKRTRKYLSKQSKTKKRKHRIGV